MKFVNGRVVASPTDLANFLTCRHKTALDLRVAAGKLKKPAWVDPLAEILFKRGKDHERRYVEYLRAQGLNVLDLEPPEAAADERPVDERLTTTRQALREGVDVIVQGALGNDQWFGYPDILRRTERGYEVIDTKLSRETRGGTILQLCVYTELLGETLNSSPKYFHVVTPLGDEVYRVEDFGAYFRQLQAALAEFTLNESRNFGRPPATYPEPVDHCEICRWSARCDGQRRGDDHLTYVHGATRLHIKELAAHGIKKLSELSAVSLPLSFAPTRGSVETYEKLREQARLQQQQRESGTPTYECLPVEAGFGLCALPVPRPGDLFLDLEGDPFGRPGSGPRPGEGNREYLFGLASVKEEGTLTYRGRWSFTDAEESGAFDDTMADIMAALESDPEIHVFHYAPYEPTAFKRLMGRYASRETDIDRLLRGGRFVDLYSVVRRAIRAGVESYSIKYLEPFYGFRREVELPQAGDQRRIIEVALETGDFSTVTSGVRLDVEGYNRDDVRSTVELRKWLEALRSTLVDSGTGVPRPVLASGDPGEKIKARDLEAIELRGHLLAGVPGDAVARTDEERARYLLAHIVDWHRREERVAYGEYHRIREQLPEDLLDEPTALVGLRHVARVFHPPTPRRAAIDRYSYPVQENDVRRGDNLKLASDESIGTVEAIDKAGLTIDIKKRVDKNDLHPEVVIALRVVNAPEQEESLRRIAAGVIANGIDDETGQRLVNDLLRARSPRLTTGSLERSADESTADLATRVALSLDESVLPVQGPPGSGKTKMGAKIIAALVDQGRKVGVVATGHEVIRKLLLEAGKAAGRPIPIARKPKENDDDETAGDPGIEEISSNTDARAWLERDGGRVLGGTAWMWAREDFVNAVDVLFVDEAGQMSLANVVSVAPASRNMVLLGDPQQLDQPSKGSHPDGVDCSMLEHMLGKHQTMPADRGIFLPETYRLHPNICRFTSELFYENRLQSAAGCARRSLSGTKGLDGAGLWLGTANHTGNRNASPEEAVVVADLVSRLLTAGATCADSDGEEHPMTQASVLVVAPFNAHLARLREALDRAGWGDVRIGTVDKFQGQEAPVVIYSMATSSPEDAPRGMEFLYSLNRLNVATSRAQCAVILVASPALFEPACATPQRMRLANALSRFREMAQLLSLSSR